MAAASSRSVGDELCDLLECVICRNTYEDPRTLPCLHTYCLKCLLRWSSLVLPGKELECPVCRKECSIPEDGLEALPRSFFIDKLKQLQANSLTSLLPSDGNFANDETASTSDTVSCQKHRDKSVDLFCLDCHMVLCSLCFNSHHRTHSCIDVAAAADEMTFRTQKDVENGIGKCRRMLQSLAESKREFVDDVDKLEDEIYRRAEQMKQVVECHKQVLVNKLESIKRNRLKDMDRLDNEIEQHWLKMTDLKRYFTELVKIGTPVDLVRESKAVRDRTGELTKIDEINRSLNDLHSKLVTFTAASETPVGTDEATAAAETTNILGKVEVVATKLTPTHVVAYSDPCPIIGIALLNDQLFVLRETRRDVEVYDTTTFASQQLVAIDGFSESACLWGMAACAVHNYLYVSDSDGAVHRIGLSAENRLRKLFRSRTTKWQVGGWPFGLSVNAATNVVVTCGENGTISEYTSDGSPIRRIRLSSSIKYPFYCRQTSNDRYVVSHGYGDESMHRVCVVDGEGRIVHRFGNKRRQAGSEGRLQQLLLDEPRDVAVTETGFVLVADKNNNRVAVMTGSLNWWRDLELSADGGVRSPRALCFDETKERLYVGEHDGMRVLVFDNVSVAANRRYSE